MKQNTSRRIFSPLLGRGGKAAGLGSGFLWLSAFSSWKTLAAQIPVPGPGSEAGPGEPSTRSTPEAAAVCLTPSEAGLYAPESDPETHVETGRGLLLIPGQPAAASWATLCSVPSFEPEALLVVLGDSSLARDALDEPSDLSGISPETHTELADLSGLSRLSVPGSLPVLGQAQSEGPDGGGENSGFMWMGLTLAGGAGLGFILAGSEDDPEEDIVSGSGGTSNTDEGPETPSGREAPRLLETVLDQTLMEDASFFLDVSTVFTHSSANDLVFEASSLPRGLHMMENDRLVGQVSDDRELGTHTITLAAREAGTTEVAHKIFTLEILNVNDKPFLTEASNVFPLLENQRVELLNINFSDIVLDDDLLDEPALFEENMTLPEGLTLAPNGRLAGRITDDNLLGANEIRITVHDEGGEEQQIVLTYTLHVLNQNDVPFLTQNAETGAENAAIQIDFRTLIRDDDLADEPELTLSSPLPAGLRFENGQVLGALTDDRQLGVHKIVVRATDEGSVLPENAFLELTYTLTVTNVNDAPRPGAPELFTLTILEETPDRQIALTTLFLDDDLEDGTRTAPLVFGAQWIQNEGSPGDPLPAFLTLQEDALHIRASETDDGDVGTYTLGLTAQDDEGLVTEHRFTLVVDDIPEDPILIKPLSNWARPAPGQSLEIDLSSHFLDEDIGDSLIFSFTEARQPGEEGDFVSTSLGGPGDSGTLLSITPVDPSTGLGESITVTATDSTGRTREEAFFVYLPQESLDLEALRTDGTVGFVVQGAQIFGRFGRAVSGLGDINGDGWSDFIVGAYWENDASSAMFDADEGKAYIFYGASEAPPVASNELPADRGFILQGQDSGDWLGRHVAPGGDVNGDGLADFIVGAPGRTGEADKKGSAYLVYGTTASRSSPLDVESLFPSSSSSSSEDASDGVQIEGGMRWDHLGHAVASAGDINGDGLDDLIIGAPYDTAGTPPSEGFALVVYGMKDGSLRTDFNPSVLTQGLGFQIQGDGTGDRLGWSVAPAGDLNGDGLGDFVVGAPSGDDGGDDAGEAYVIFGKLDPDGTRLGEAMSDSDETGALTGALIYQGLDTNFLEPTAGFILQGARAQDGLGYQVAAAGDVNGDGLDDLLVGTAPESTGDTREAYLLFGQRTIEDFGRIVYISAENNDQTLSPSEANSDEHEAIARRVLEVSHLSPESGLVIQAPARPSGSNLDHHLVFASAGDVNGDGLADTLIGLSPGNENKDLFNQPMAGGPGFDEVYLLYGTQGMFYGSLEAASSNVERHILPIDALEPQDGLVLQTPSADPSVQNLFHDNGVSVAGAGDVNQDGFDDFLIGLYNTNVSSMLQQTGESFLVYGNPNWRVGRSAPSSETPSGTSDPLSTLIGSPDDDSLTEALDGMGEVFYGGAGDDVIHLTDASFLRVDGGAGQDTLELGREVTLDLAFEAPPPPDATPDPAGRSFGSVLRIETLTLQEDASVRLDLLALYRLTEQRDNDVQLGDATREDLTDPGQVLVRIMGSSSASVTLAEGLHDAGDPASDPAGLWAAAEETVDGHTLLGLENALVLIEDGIQILSDA